MTKLPPRTYDTMSDAISLSSPSGRMSKRSKEAMQEDLRVKLFGKEGLSRPGLPKQPSKQENLRRHAARLRDLADRGMSTRSFRREAAKLEEQALLLDIEENKNKG